MYAMGRVFGLCVNPGRLMFLRKMLAFEELAAATNAHSHALSDGDDGDDERDNPP